MADAPRSAALRLADWIRARYPYASAPGLPLTHLKLQKLCFYAAAVAWANDAGDDLGDLPFLAWKHGPVLKDVFAKYTACGSSAIDGDPAVSPGYSDVTERHLENALRVYGLLSAWAIREESHEEAPWREARASDAGPPSPAPQISRESIERHFRNVWAHGNVTYPKFLTDPGVFTLDDIPYRPRFRTFTDLATHIRNSVPIA